MENTIKKDNNRKIYYQEYLNDNALFEIILNREDKKSEININLRYIKNQRINEVHLTSMSLKEFVDNAFQLIEFNDEKNAIAIFKKVETGYQLDRIYDVLEQSFVFDDFIDVAYGLKFNESASKINQYLIKPHTKK